jgi:hypothetical protein
MVIQAAEPWMSDTDIEKGSRGFDEISRALGDIKVGIVFLTPENLTAKWILYEAGALSKTIDDKTRLCTYLLGGLNFQDVDPPLGMFQYTKADQEDTRKLVRTINRAVSDEPLPESRLDAVFEAFWPQLERDLQTMPEPGTVVDAKRPADQMLAEILEFTRAEANRRKKSDILDQYLPMFTELLPAFMPLLSEAVKATKAQQERSSMASTREAVRFEGTVRGQGHEASCTVRATKVTLPGTNEFAYSDYLIEFVSETLPPGKYEVTAGGKTIAVRLENGFWLSA